MNKYGSPDNHTPAMPLNDLPTFGQFWERWPCEYEKMFYDIKLNDEAKTVVKQCWPNASTFHSPQGHRYESEDVAEIRPSDNQMNAM